MERCSELVRPAAVVLAVVAGLGCVLLGVTTVLSPAPSLTTGAAAADHRTGAPPAALRIPDLDLAVNQLVALGHTAGRREQPGTALGVGWFSDGPPPGSPGVAVLSGHAGFGYALGAFARLAKLKPGAAIATTDASGHETRFTVRRVALFPANEPDSTLVASDGPGPQLRLITSDGSYDSAGLGGARVAVYAALA